MRSKSQMTTPMIESRTNRARSTFTMPMEKIRAMVLQVEPCSLLRTAMPNPDVKKGCVKSMRDSRSAVMVSAATEASSLPASASLMSSLMVCFLNLNLSLRSLAIARQS